LSRAALSRAALAGRDIDLDVAVHNAEHLDPAVTVKSSRCAEAVADLRARIRPFHGVTAAREFDDRALIALAGSYPT